MEVADKMMLRAHEIFSFEFYNGIDVIYLTADCNWYVKKSSAIDNCKRISNDSITTITRNEVSEWLLAKNFGENTVDKPFIIMEPVQQLNVIAEIPLKYLLERYRIRHKVHTDDFTKEIEYLIKKNEELVANKIKDACIYFLDSIRNYERENGVSVCYDERDSEEFYQIHITPIGDND